MLKVKYFFFMNAGTYYVSINSNNEACNYSLSAVNTDSKETFVETTTKNDDSIPTANSITYGNTIYGQVSSEYVAKDKTDYYDYYKFEVTKSGRVTFDFDFMTYNRYFSFYNSDGEEWEYYIRDYDASKGTNKEIFNLDLVPGTYYLRIEAFRRTTMVPAGRTSSGQYNFKATFAAAGESVQETETSNNNNIASASAIELNKDYVGQIAFNDSCDFYKFTLPKGYVLDVTYSSAKNHLEKAWVDLYKADGTKLNSKWVGFDETLGKAQYKETFTLDAGNYVFAVLADKYDVTGVYNFKLSATTTGTTKPSSKPSTKKMSDTVKITKVKSTVSLRKGKSVKVSSLYKVDKSKISSVTCKLKNSKIAKATSSKIKGVKKGSTKVTLTFKFKDKSTKTITYNVKVK